MDQVLWMLPTVVLLQMGQHLFASGAGKVPEHTNAGTSGKGAGSSDNGAAILHEPTDASGAAAVPEQKDVGTSWCGAAAMHEHTDASGAATVPEPTDARTSGCGAATLRRVPCACCVLRVHKATGAMFVLSLLCANAFQRV